MASLDVNDTSGDLTPLFQTIADYVPAPEYEEGHGLQALVCNLDASPYLGRLALCRVINGTLERGQRVAWCRIDGTIEHAKITELFITEALERSPRRVRDPATSSRSPVSRTSPLVRRSPIPTTRSRSNHSTSMNQSVNDHWYQHVAPRRTEGKLLTARMVKDRLDRELVGNVALRVLNTERPDAWKSRVAESSNSPC